VSRFLPEQEAAALPRQAACHAGDALLCGIGRPIL